MAKANFNSYWKQKNEVKSNCGSPIVDEYEMKIDEFGRESLVKTGETDLQEYIESFADSVDINRIMERYINGDESALDKVAGFYADVADMPTNIIDVINLQREGEDLFDQLPTHVKEIYNNSYYEFLTDPMRYQEQININVDEADVETEVKNDDEE